MIQTHISIQLTILVNLEIGNMSFTIEFEGQKFVAEVNEDDEVRITNEIILPVNAQMFFHLKESLVQQLRNGEHDIVIRKAINEEVELLVL